MAQTKISQISKDFGMKSKDVTEIFKAIGYDKKSGATVEEEEFEIFISHLTRTHQIKNMEAYTKGDVKITVKKAEAPKKEEKKATKPAAKGGKAKAAKKAEAESEDDDDWDI